MVRATLAGVKTQTRRACRDQSANEYKFVTDMKTIPTGPLYTGWAKDCGQSFVLPTKCPYGQAGDRLWVREAWCMPAGDRHVIYRADWSDADIAASKSMRRYFSGITRAYPDSHWRPSIHMPRKHCRLLLQVTAVRAERLQEISERDARAEGIDAVSLSDLPRQATWSRRQDFAQLWDSLNLKRGYGWGTKPWVWVIEFKQC